MWCWYFDVHFKTLTSFSKPASKHLDGRHPCRSRFGVDPPTQRYLRTTIVDDLARKLVFIGGPSQVGKTSLARSPLPPPKCGPNYDIAAQREAILRRRLPAGDFWFFDEIHKFRGWRKVIGKGPSGKRSPG